MQNNFILRICTKKQTDELFIIFKNCIPHTLYHDRIKLENDHKCLWNYSATLTNKEYNFKLKKLTDQTTLKIIK